MRIFKEEQRFTQNWLLVLITISIIVPIILIVNEFSKENSNMSMNEFIFSIVLIPLCIAPIFFFKLKTRIDETGIHYQFFPFHFSTKTIPWLEIKSVNTRKYYAITEYGGWGLKSGFLSRKSKGIAYTVSGDQGIQLVMKNGEKILIGTNKENDIIAVLKNHENKLLSNEI
jgi:hypothetical protein